jgi:hypothetical protein
VRVSNAGHTSSLSIATIKADNSSVIANCRQWQNAVACQIQNCSTWQQLRSLWLAIEEDCKKHKKQYDDEHQPFLCKIWTKRWNRFGTSKSTESAVNL